MVCRCFCHFIIIYPKWQNKHGSLKVCQLFLPFFTSFQYLKTFKIVDEGLDRLRDLSVNDEGWSANKEKDGVVLHHRHSEDSPIVMLVSY